jgi:hypothetical protein
MGVVMKCLEKQRDRRYETANGLARDLQRYLADEPVEARPPSSGYRLRKFVRRNKGPTVAAGGLAFALLAGIASTSWGLIRANEEWQAEAERAEGKRQARDREAAQRQRAEANEAKAVAAAGAEKQAREEVEAVLGFVESRVFTAARLKDQDGGLGYDVKLADAVKAALPFVDKSFATQPLIEARLRRTTATSFESLGDPRTAVEQEEKARALYTRHRGPDHPDALKCMVELASSYRTAGRTREASKLFEELLQLT